MVSNMSKTEKELKNLIRYKKPSVIKKVKYAQDLCFDDWVTQYPHNRLLSKFLLLGMILICSLTIVAII